MKLQFRTFYYELLIYGQKSWRPTGLAMFFALEIPSLGFVFHLKKKHSGGNEGNVIDL